MQLRPELAREDFDEVPLPSPLKLSVIVVNWRVRDLLRACLQSLHAQIRMPAEEWELIVVDNDSGDGSAAMVQEEFPQAILLANAENLGFAKANNQAFGICRGRHILLLNPDTVVLDSAVDRMLEVLETRLDVAAVGCRLLRADGSLEPWTGGHLPGLANVTCHFLFAYQVLPAWLLPLPLFLESEPVQDAAVGWVSGACMLLRREALASPLFDERFFLYGEDMDLCDRLTRSGWKVLYTPRTAIIHLGGRSVAAQTPEIQLSRIPNLRKVFAARHGRTALVVFDLVVSLGFLLRSLAFALAARARRGRGYEHRAGVSRQYWEQAFRTLVDR
ncbi:MAG: glycosyltransferase family 2 protein [Terriglobia bacterium]